MASISISTPSDPERRRSLTWFRGLATATVISVFVLVIIGGVVRVTGSGLGCPDWPLCYGRLLPPLEYTAIIEYTHRFVASVIVGPLVLVTAVVGIVRFRKDRWVWVPAVVSVPLLIVQALLGGITVLTHLPGGVVALHLATAEALLATCVFIMVASYRTRVFLTATPPSNDGYYRWAIVGAFSVYAVIVSGSLVTAMGATGACVTWPLCQGQAFPMNHLTAIHMFPPLRGPGAGRPATLRDMALLERTEGARRHPEMAGGPDRGNVHRASNSWGSDHLVGLPSALARPASDGRNGGVDSGGGHGDRGLHGRSYSRVAAPSRPSWRSKMASSTPRLLPEEMRRKEMRPSKSRPN